MHWGPLGVRLSIVAVYLVIAAIIIMSILPLATGKLQVSIPEEGGSEPTINGRIVSMTVPVDITNDGYFNIEDLTVRFTVSDGGRVLMEQSSVPVDVVAGRTSHLDLTIAVDLDDIDEQDLKGLVFNATVLDLDVSVNAGYSLGLVRASIGTQQEMEWEPMVSGLSISGQNLQWENNGTNVDVLVPYYFEASGMALGKTVDLDASLSNSTAVLGTASRSLIVDQVNQGTLRFVVSQEAFLWLLSHPQALTLGADVSLLGATMHLDRTIDPGVIA
jgi:hypothetical protein